MTPEEMIERLRVPFGIKEPLTTEARLLSYVLSGYVAALQARMERLEQQLERPCQA